MGEIGNIEGFKNEHKDVPDLKTKKADTPVVPKNWRPSPSTIAAISGIEEVPEPGKSKSETEK